jgi:hypothetical protein
MHTTIQRILLVTCLFTCAATALAEDKTYGDWVAKVAPDPVWERLSEQGVDIQFALNITGREIKNGAESNDMYAFWSVVCRKTADTPWVLVLVVPYGVEGPSLTVNFDNERDVTVGLSDGEVTQPELLTILAGMQKGSVMNYRKNGAPRSLRLGGISAALTNHLDVCPAEGTLKIAQELGL